jgi:hypothetical protein
MLRSTAKITMRGDITMAVDVIVASLFTRSRVAKTNVTPRDNATESANTIHDQSSAPVVLPSQPLPRTAAGAHALYAKRAPSQTRPLTAAADKATSTGRAQPLLRSSKGGGVSGSRMITSAITANTNAAITDPTPITSLISSVTRLLIASWKRGVNSDYPGPTRPEARRPASRHRQPAP